LILEAEGVLGRIVGAVEPRCTSIEAGAYIGGINTNAYCCEKGLHQMYTNLGEQR
jgi:hypothetical protein